MSNLTMIKHLLLCAVAVTIATTASAQTGTNTSRPIPPPGGPLPSGTSAARWAGNMLYVSGALDPDLKTHTDTKSQTVGLITYLQKVLESQNLTLGDVIMLHVYLGGELGKPDFDGMMGGYTQFFGTKEQPNKPARTTVQVVLPAGARGGLIEMDLVAMRPDSSRSSPRH